MEQLLNTQSIMLVLALAACGTKESDVLDIPLDSDLPVEDCIDSMVLCSDESCAIDVAFKSVEVSGSLMVDGQPVIVAPDDDTPYISVFSDVSQISQTALFEEGAYRTNVLVDGSVEVGVNWRPPAFPGPVNAHVIAGVVSGDADAVVNMELSSHETGGTLILNGEPVRGEGIEWTLTGLNGAESFFLRGTSAESWSARIPDGTWDVRWNLKRGDRTMFMPVPVATGWSPTEPLDVDVTAVSVRAAPTLDGVPLENIVGFRFTSPDGRQYNVASPSAEVLVPPGVWTVDVQSHGSSTPGGSASGLFRVAVNADLQEDVVFAPDLAMHRVTGRVEMPGGIGGYVVWFQPTDGSAREFQLGVDEGGTFDGYIPAGTYDVLIRPISDDAGLPQSPFAVLHDQVVEGDEAFVLEPELVTLSGTLDFAGIDAPGDLSYLLHASRDNDERFTQRFETPDFSMALPAGTFLIQVSFNNSGDVPALPGFQIVDDALELMEDRTLEVDLPVAYLRGHVTLNGEPLSDEREWSMLTTRYDEPLVRYADGGRAEPTVNNPSYSVPLYAGIYEFVPFLSNDEDDPAAPIGSLAPLCVDVR